MKLMANACALPYDASQVPPSVEKAKHHKNEMLFEGTAVMRKVLVRVMML